MVVRQFLPALLAVPALVAPATPADMRPATAQPATAPLVTPAAATPAAKATAEARRLGRPVPVAAEQGETRDVFANPDGTFRAKLYMNPVRVRRSTGWVPVDTTLQRRQDGIVPAATTRTTVFSSGGRRPLVRLYDGNRWLELLWPAPLPVPVLHRDTATYRDVLPGVDLRMRATAQGFTKVFVVTTRAAAANPKLTDLRFGLRTRGLDAKLDRAGNVAFRDAAGSTVLGTAAPMMWDSGTIRRPGKMTLTGRQIRLLPDKTLLTGPDTKFPLYIDPPFQPSRTGFALVYSGHPGNSYWGGDGENLGKVGKCPESLTPGIQCGSPNIGVARSFFRFDGSFLLGKHILRGEFNAFSVWSPSCSARQLDAWGTNPVDGGTTWWNQPWPGGGPTYLGWHNVAAGYNANCPGRALGWGDWDPNPWDDRDDPPIITVVKNAQRFTGGIITIMLKAANESDEYAWKKFAHNGDTPYFTVVYNSWPNLPDSRTVENQPCAQAPNEPQVNPFVNGDPNQGLRGPRLAARISDPDGGLVRGRFEVFNRARDRWLWTGESVLAGSGATVGVDVPSAHAADGAKLSYRVLSSDDTDTSAWSSWCDVTIDRTAPSQVPAVSSATYPECAPPDFDPCPISGGIGRTGGFTLTANGVTDVAGFRYDLHDQPSTYVAANSSGVASVLITPPDDKPQDLYVRSVDKAGNVGPMYRYHFRVGPGTPPKGHWRLDGGLETAVLDDSSAHHDGSITWGPAFWLAGRHRDGLFLNGTAAAFVSTGNGRTVDTRNTFSVAAWVKLDRIDAGWRTAVSQDGNQISGFFLQFNPNTRKWNFMMPASDTNAAERHIAESALPAVAGRWTHLVGSFDAATKRVQIHVDGVPGVSASHGTPWDAPGTVQLGRARYNGLVDNWLGMLDDVRIHDRLLSIEEIRALATTPATEALFWTLDEGAGTGTIDVAGNYVHGGFAAGVSWVPGRVGAGAIRLDGTSGWVRTAAPVVRTDDSFTVTAWVRLDQSGTAFQTVLSQDGASSSGFMLRYRGDTGAWSFALSDNGSRLVSVDAADPAFAGEWTHVSGVYDGAAGRIRLYVNGALAGDVAARATVNAAGMFRIGRGMGTTSFLGGAVDDVHAWTGVRTADQIRAEYLNPPTERTTAYTGQLSRYWNNLGHHVVTTEAVPPGSSYEISLGQMAPDDAPDTVIIYSCRNGATDYYLAQNGCSGGLELGRIGMLYLNPPADVPGAAVYSCLLTTTGTHFASHHANCEGHTAVGRLGYAPAYVKLARSISAADNDHITSIARVPGHYRPEGSLGLVANLYLPGTTSLWICRDGRDTFTSTQADCEGKTVERWIGQIWLSPPDGVTGAAELFRCRATSNELFDSLDPDCEGHTQVRSLGFVVTEL